MPSRPALHAAIVRGELYTVKELVAARGAAVYDLDPKRRNALLLAVERDEIEIAAFLIGQFPGLVESRGGRYSRTALHVVSQRGQHRLLQFLLSLGTSELEARDRQGRTPLVLAVLARRMDVMHMLVHAGASLETKDWDGNRALHYASRRSGVYVCRCLVDMGCEVRVENEEVQSALDWAAMGGQADTCRFLLEQGLDVCKVDHSRRTALHHAVATMGPGRAETVQVLLRWGGARLALAKDRQGRLAEDYSEEAMERGDADGKEVDRMIREVTRAHARGVREEARAKARRDALAVQSTRTVNRASVARIQAARAKLADMAREPHWTPLPPIKYRPPPPPPAAQEPETGEEEQEEEDEEKARGRRGGQAAEEEEEEEQLLLRAAEDLLLRRGRSLSPGKVRRRRLLLLLGGGSTNHSRSCAAKAA